jgi:hypothetical protein
MTSNAGRLTPDIHAGERPQSQSRLMATHPLPTRRSPMSPSRTRCIGMAVPTDALAVASGAHAHGAAVRSLGPLGPRQCAIDHLGRTMPSKATPLGCVYAAGPWGSWRSRS